MSLVLEPTCGPPEVLGADAWHRPASVGETGLIRAAGTPLLDVGCGPGRVVAAAAGLGIPALGIDAAPAAVTHATTGGVAALHRSVFDRLPGEGRWGCVVLLDGNVGIGGDVARLLTRCREVLADHGQILVEVAPPSSPRRVGPARLVGGDTCSRWFPWAWVDEADLGPLAAGSGLFVRARTAFDARCFAWLARDEQDAGGARAGAVPIHPTSVSRWTSPPDDGSSAPATPPVPTSA